MIEVHNPYELKIRPEKQIAGTLGLSASHLGFILIHYTVIPVGQLKIKAETCVYYVSRKKT